MDTQHEKILHFQGFVGVFKQSLKIILQKPKLFTYITLAFIIPLACISQPDLFNYFFASSTTITTTNTNTSTVATGKYNNDTTSLSSLPNNNFTTTKQSPPAFNVNINLKYFSLKYIIPWLINQIIYQTFILTFSLLSTAAVIYTATCIYTSKEITFKRVLSVVPKVWKRLMITLLSNFGIFAAYCAIILVIITIITIFLCVVSIFIMVNTSYRPNGNVKTGVAMLMTSMTAFLAVIGWICMDMFWQLGNVISVLEDFCGFKAMIRSMKLIKGNKKTALVLALVPFVCSQSHDFLVNQMLENVANIKVKFLVAIVSVVVSSLLDVYWIVVQTMFYFVCKSCHHEDIDKSTLDHHLETFVGEYALLEEGDHTNHIHKSQFGRS